MDDWVMLVALGSILLCGLALDAVGRIVHVPRVTLLMIMGAVAGPPLFGRIPEELVDNSGVFSDVALTMVAFLLGGSLRPEDMKKHGREIFSYSISIVIVSAVFVTVALWALGADPALALLLGAISVATAPAATMDVIRQSGNTGHFAKTIRGIVAIDDVWGILLFSASMVIAGVLIGVDFGASMVNGLWEIFGAILIGISIGFPASYLTGRVKAGEPTLVEAVGVVVLCCGVASALDVSFLLTGITCGAVIVNFALHHERPFHEIERIEWPFMLLFFVLAGASFEAGNLSMVWSTVIGFVVFRVAARFVGGLIGAVAIGKTVHEGLLTGLALSPQAGVSIGMALVAADQFPSLAEPLIAIVMITTIIFELVGPFGTQFALSRQVTTATGASG
ncbi:transporter (CPA2 family) [Hoeflea halophila]|uniref:Transporter (CPA2 family) n=1 Tax=Hoeflea halophila TaxID=714899 RepID=A0A286IDP1_9HYPH|nr:cation:proton antiporter [Hoeflea halophila]SOE18240.1 transporter (CPA2 family) [Hoeflea halophila]